MRCSLATANRAYLQSPFRHIVNSASFVKRIRSRIPVHISDDLHGGADNLPLITAVTHQLLVSVGASSTSMVMLRLPSSGNWFVRTVRHRPSRDLKDDCRWVKV